MGARYINDDGTPIKKVVGAKKQYENINGVFKPVYYDGYVLYNGLTTDGTAYIDLGRKGNGNNTHIIDFTLTDLSTDVGIYGNRINNDNSLGVFYIKSSNILVVLNSKTSDVALTALYVNNPTLGRYVVTLSGAKSTCRHDGVLTTKNYTGEPCLETPGSLKVFRFNKSGSPTTYFQNSLTVHSIEEYSPSGLLLHQYVPAQRISDVALGLLDVVNGVFHTNAAGSGSFSV